MATTLRTMRLEQQLRDQLTKVTNTHVRALVAAWADAWDEVQPDLTEALLEQLTANEHISRAQLLRSTRLRAGLQVIADNLRQLSKDAGVLILGDLQAVIDTAGGAQASVIDSQLPADSAALVDLESWSRVDERQITAIVHRSTQQITSSLRPLAPETYAVVRRELIRGVVAGSNPRATAARMVKRAQAGFNGNLGLTRALRISRTETLDAFRAGAHLGRMQHADVLRGWSWHCELSSRSCPACISMDGQVFPLDVPGPDDHVNGRCTAIPETKSWADLGIDIAEPPSIRQDGQTWFNQQTPATQRSILGPSRYDAWKAGDYPPEMWARTVQNPDWRSSVQVSKVPGAYKGGRADGSALAS